MGEFYTFTKENKNVIDVNILIELYNEKSELEVIEEQRNGESASFWLLPDGRYSGDAKSHNGAAKKVLVGYGIALEPFSLTCQLMKLSGVIRVRSSVGIIIVDFVYSPTEQQLESIKHLEQFSYESNINFLWEMRNIYDTAHNDWGNSYVSLVHHLRKGRQQ